MKRRCSNCGWLEVNPSGAIFCGYSDERTWENESCLAWKDKDEPQTNADRIRVMTDEELAEFVIGVLCYTKLPYMEVREKALRGNELLGWLKEEASE